MNLNIMIINGNLKKDDSSTIYLNDDKVIDNEISINYGDKNIYLWT
ncbi:MAG: hypothetical protein L6V81_04590 [Clostridium sp.]|nr:MAG: hypothetical protein L6V81_04590 [Clostridium sp.]